MPTQGQSAPQWRYRSCTPVEKRMSLLLRIFQHRSTRHDDHMTAASRYQNIIAMNRYLGFQEETVRNENVLMTWICILLGYCSSRWFVAALSRSGTLYTLHGFQCSKIGPTQPLPAVAAQGTVINKKTIQSERRCWNQTNLQMCACNSCLIIMALRCHWLLCH